MEAEEAAEGGDPQEEGEEGEPREDELGEGEGEGEELAEEEAPEPVDEGPPPSESSEEMDLEGEIGDLLQDAFVGFFDEPKEEGEGDEEVAQNNQELDFVEEEEVIEQSTKRLEADKKRLADLRAYLDEQAEAAKKADEDIAAYLKSEGLIIKEDFPVEESQLRVDHDTLEQNNLMVPRHLMLKYEKKIRIAQGKEQKYEDKFASAKPAEPNYLKSTPELDIRKKVRGIVPHLNDAQRATLKRRAEQRRLVEKLKQKVHLKNPRLDQLDKQLTTVQHDCPFRVIPNPIIFRNYEVGGVYEIVAEVANRTDIGRRIRIKPFDSDIISFELEYRGPPITAPGMSTYVHIRYIPTDLNEVEVNLTLQTELGEFEFPVRSRRHQPKLDFPEIINCGEALAGGPGTINIITFHNKGGEGAFRLVPPDDYRGEDYQYAIEKNERFFSFGPFKITPASFYLTEGEKQRLTISFSGIDQNIANVTRRIAIECDNHLIQYVTLTGKVDGLRCEMIAFNDRILKPPDTFSVPSEWQQLLPWRLDWSTQVRQSQSYSVEVGNGSSLPQKFKWIFYKPPRAVLRQLATGTIPILTSDLLNTIHHWDHCKASYSVTPSSIVVPPFSTQQFDFSFLAQPPIGKMETIFAALVSIDLPTDEMIEMGGGKELRRALVSFNDAIDLQLELNPHNYTSGIPLTGNVLFDYRPKDPLKIKEEANTTTEVFPMRPTIPSCLFFAICLQGVTLAPKLEIRPPCLTYPGSILPWIPQVQTVIIKNTGGFPSKFNVRRLQQGIWEQADYFNPLHVGSEEDECIGPGPSNLRNLIPPDMSDEMCTFQPREDLWRHYVSNMWPSLPPEYDASSKAQGQGALATVVVRPHCGVLEPGQSIELEVIMRVKRECDIDAVIHIDMDSSCPPVYLRVIAAVRSPQLQITKTSCLDYGIVMAHQSHVRPLKLTNPNRMPVLARIEHDGKVVPFPLETNDDVSAFYLGEIPVPQKYKHYLQFFDQNNYVLKENYMLGEDCLFGPKILDNTDVEAFLSPRSKVSVGIPEKNNSVGLLDESFTEQEESIHYDPIEPWNCAACGCADTSQRPGPMQKNMPDSTFLFAPWIVVPPQTTIAVSINFRARHVETYSSILDIRTLDTTEPTSIGVHAEVQLPTIRISQSHILFPVTYLKHASDPISVTLYNDSDMSASFRWKLQDPTDSPLELQISPIKGTIQAQQSRKIDIVVVAVVSNPEGIGRAETKCIVHGRIQSIPLLLTSHIYGVEVDATILKPDDEIPTVATLPRVLDETIINGTFPETIFSIEGSGTDRLVDFEEMEVMKTKIMHICLFNRSNLSVPFQVNVESYPCYDPFKKSKQITQTVMAVTRMQTTMMKDSPRSSEEASTVDCSVAGSARGDEHANSPKAVLNRGQEEPIRKNFLLNDTHEARAFHSFNGRTYALQKTTKAAGSVALTFGFGWAIRCMPTSGWLDPGSHQIVECTVFSDLPGLMEDTIRLRIRGLDDFLVPTRLLSFGSPLYLPPMQVALNTLVDPPVIDGGLLVLADGSVTRTLKVGNNSMSAIYVKWEAHCEPQLTEEEVVEQIAEAEEVGAPSPKHHPGGGGRPLRMADAIERRRHIIQENGSCPVKVTPSGAVIPCHGFQTFTVTLSACEVGFYSYSLVGKAYVKRGRGPMVDPFHETSTTGNGIKEKDTLAGVSTDIPNDTKQISVDGTKTLDTHHFFNPERRDDIRTVMELPDIPCEDSDDEEQVSLLSRSMHHSIEIGNDTYLPRSPGISPSAQRASELKELLEQDPLTTMTVKMEVECVQPKLTIDKKDDTNGAPTVKFYATSVADPDLKKEKQVSIFGKVGFSGPVVVGGGNKDPIRGIVVALIRCIHVSNEHKCPVHFTARIPSIGGGGGFKIVRVEKVGTWPTKNIPRTGIVETLQWKESIQIWVEFIPPKIEKWSSHDHPVEGELLIEYPHVRGPHASMSVVPSETQRVNLAATCRKPKLGVSLLDVPTDQTAAKLALPTPDHTMLTPPNILVVRFYRVHVQSLLEAKRKIILINDTNVIANWKVFHVGRKAGRKQPGERDTIDSCDVFEFEHSVGALYGPSLPYRCCPLGPALDHYIPHEDTHRFQPHLLTITFHPLKNEEYLSRFRFQVEGGASLDILCHGFGSYREEDDVMDLIET